MHRRFRVQVAFRVAVIAALVAGAAYLVLGLRLYLPGGLLGACAIPVAVSLVRYVEKTTRDLTRFLESVRYADFTRRFTTDGRGPVFEDLRDAFEDVTAEFRRLRAEKERQVQYLQQVVQHLGVALITYQDDGEVETMNTAARRLLRTGPIRHVEALERVSDELAETLRTLDSGEQAMVRVEEEDRTLQLAVRVSRFQLQGEPHALASIQDLRNELEEKEMEAWQQLTSVLTHEIMNSVAPISSLASTASRRLRVGERNGTISADQATDAREAVNTIERRSEGLMNFVDAYRSFTDIPAPEFEVLDAEGLLSDVEGLLRAQIEEQNLAVVVSVDPSGLTLSADPDLLDQLLINLALNAVQALEEAPGTGQGRIELRAFVDRRSRPVIQVEDNGPGIPDDVQEKIFVPFFTTKEEGSGIGLSLSRQIMRLHGGRLSVRSTEGDGAVFTLRF
ncbi:sensor histidine kinase [Salinibacter altiplanensis]|uniref:sensor histidine kinase n=1 Tax=Salinibacter altiplanensis TaxID=1803181 RepID=UPI00131A5A2A|nr:ATP-binding protein [Salinibacter altiplanensis]